MHKSTMLAGKGVVTCHCRVMLLRSTIRPTARCADKYGEDIISRVEQEVCSFATAWDYAFNSTGMQEPQNCR